MNEGGRERERENERRERKEEMRWDEEVWVVEVSECMHETDVLLRTDGSPQSPNPNLKSDLKHHLRCHPADLQRPGRRTGVRRLQEASRRKRDGDGDSVEGIKQRAPKSVLFFWIQRKHRTHSWLVYGRSGSFARMEAGVSAGCIEAAGPPEVMELSPN